MCYKQKTLQEICVNHKYMLSKLIGNCVFRIRFAYIVINRLVLFALYHLLLDNNNSYIILHLPHNP